MAYFRWHDFFCKPLIRAVNRAYVLHLMEKTKILISSLELKRLLVSIVDSKMSISFRYRLLGEMWQPNFIRVLKVTEKGVLLNDDIKNKLIAIHDLSGIMQFELDQTFQNFLPHFHYEVTLMT